MWNSKHRAERMRRCDDKKTGIFGADMRGLAGRGFRQMHTMRADGARQCGVVRNQQNQAALTRDGAQAKRAFGALFGVAGPDNHQACRWQGVGGGAGIRQAYIVGYQGKHARVEGTRRSC